MQKLPPKEILFKNILEFKVGDIYNLDELKKTLVNLGYSRCEFIEGRGQFSVRGGIVDISADDKTGIRIELWGDEVDSIRNFSISSQRSISTLERAKIYPANGRYSTKFVDLYGNISLVFFDVTEIESGFTISKVLNADNTVTVTVKSKSKLKDTKPTWKLSEDQMSYSKTYPTNGTYTTKFIDVNETEKFITFVINELK